MEYNSVFKKKKILKYATTWMNFEDIMLKKISKSQMTNNIKFYLHKALRVVRFIETESREVVASS